MYIWTDINKTINQLVKSIICKALENFKQYYFAMILKYNLIKKLKNNHEYHE